MGRGVLWKRQVHTSFQPGADNPMSTEVEVEVRKLDEAENRDVIDSWYEEARKQTKDTLPAFLTRLTTAYSHDYGTICHAMAACAIAAATAVDRSPQGGITGFQAGAVMWEFIRNWSGRYKDVPLRLVDYSNMLYPQYADHFDKIISSDTHAWLQKKATEMLDERGDDAFHPEVLTHLKLISQGMVPFGYDVKKDN